MKTNIFNLFILASLILLFLGCSKDLGNNKYHNNEFIIINDISTQYLPSKGQLTITPTVKNDAGTAINDSNKEDYDFKWYVYGAYAKAPLIIGDSFNLNMTGSLKKYPIREEQDSVQLNFGKYDVRFRITDKKTGFFQEKLFKLTYANDTFEGWLVLNEIAGGNSRLDMLSTIEGMSNPFLLDVFKKYNNTYPVNGKPTYISFAQNNMIDFAAGGIVIANSKMAATLQIDTFIYQEKNNLATLFRTSVRPSNQNNQSIYQTNFYNGVLVSDNKLFSSFFTSTQSIRNFYGPIKDENGEVITVSKYIAMPFDYKDINKFGFNYIVYDSKNSQFLMVPRTNSQVAYKMNNNNLFNFQDPTKTLLYLGFTEFGGGQVYALLKDNSNGVYLAKFTTTGTQLAYQKLPTQEINDADQFAIDNRFGYLFYNNGDKLYQYDPQQNRSFLMKTYSGEQISYIDFQKFTNRNNYPSYENYKNQLIVGTYKPADMTSGGTLHFYKVEGQNKVVEEIKAQAGFGKIVDVTYRER